MFFRYMKGSEMLDRVLLIKVVRNRALLEYTPKTALTGVSSCTLAALTI